MKGPTIYYPIQEMYGTDLSSTKKAFDLRKDILEQIDLGFGVELDFQNVRSTTSGWSRNLIGLILKQYGEDFIKKNIKFINMNKNVRTNLLEGISELV